MPTTTLTEILADTDTRYAFLLDVDGLTVRVDCSVVLGDHYGAHAVAVAPGVDYPGAAAYLYNGTLSELPSYAVRSSVVDADRAAFRTRRILRVLAADVERFVQTLPAERIVDAAAAVGIDLDAAAAQELDVLEAAAEEAERYAAEVARTIFALVDEDDDRHAADAAAEMEAEVAAMREQEEMAERAVARDEALYGPSEPII